MYGHSLLQAQEGAVALLKSGLEPSVVNKPCQGRLIVFTSFIRVLFTPTLIFQVVQIIAWGFGVVSRIQKWPAGGGDSTGSADGAGTGLWRLGVWCEESMPQHVLKRTQRTHTCMCGLKAHHGCVQGCVGEYDEGEGETDRGWCAD